MKTKKIIFAIMSILITLILISANTFAATKNELQNQTNELQDQIDQTKEELSEIGANLKGTLKDIQKLNSDISTYEGEIKGLDSQIGELEGKIVEAEKQLKDAEDKYNKQEEMFENRLVALYEAGDTTYLDMLLSSSGLTDFISNYYLVSEIATYDTELLDQMEKNKIEITAIKTSLETSKNEIETVRKNKKATAQALKDAEEVKQKYAAELTEDEKEKQAELEQFEKDKRAIQAQLAALAAQENKNNTQYIPGNPSSSGYIFPVAGLSVNNINVRTYPSYAGHTGVDININASGKSVVAVKAGTVVISTALKNANGTYRSYGEYIVINHYDGTMTLYAHGIAGSRRVSVGQDVAQRSSINDSWKYRKFYWTTSAL